MVFDWSVSVYHNTNVLSHNNNSALYLFIVLLMLSSSMVLFAVRSNPCPHLVHISPSKIKKKKHSYNNYYDKTLIDLEIMNIVR